jgi:hypothetical protein
MVTVTLLSYRLSFLVHGMHPTWLNPRNSTKSINPKHRKVRFTHRKHTAICNNSDGNRDFAAIPVVVFGAWNAPTWLNPKNSTKSINPKHRKVRFTYRKHTAVSNNSDGNRDFVVITIVFLVHRIHPTGHLAADL